MMGHSHAISGILGWVVVAPILSSRGVMPPEVAVLITGAIVTSGAALLPDLDHPQSTIARTFGPVSQAISHGVNIISGGHRMMTHSLFFTALTTGGTWAAIHFLGDVAAWVIIFAMAGLAARGLHLGPKSGMASWATTTGVAVAVTAVAAVWGPSNFEWLYWAMGVGVFLHLVGDSITPSGIPLFWPSKLRLALPVLPSTGGFVELKILTPIMILAIVWYTFQAVQVMGLTLF
jgi:membrane-bound metal-dependent hydrolase YbcI (DUF457 family)